MEKLIKFSLIFIFFLSGKLVGVSHLPTSHSLELEKIKSSIADHDEGVIKSLLEKGMDIQDLLEGNASLLQIAIIAHTDIDLIKTLIDRGINVNNIDDNGSTAISVAVVCANLNPKCYNYYAEVSKLLINNGANPNIKEKETGQTPLYLLCLSKEVNKHERLITILLEGGANPNIQDNKYKFTSLHCAIQRNASVSIVNQLLAYGANPLIQCCSHPYFKAKEEANALHLAVRVAVDPAIVETLLKSGVDPNAKNNIGWASLEFAIAAAKQNINLQNTIATTKLLIKYGADTKAQRSYCGSIAKVAEEVLGKNHPVVTLLQEASFKK